MLIGGVEMRAVPEIDDELDRRIEALGYELVEVRWGGSGRRPMLKLRIDRPDDHGECAQLFRG